jgi:hypothetical protein
MLIEMEGSDEWMSHDDLEEDEDDGGRREYHLHLPGDLGPIRRSKHTYRMTAFGHDYLGAIRNETVWNKTKAGAKKIGGATVQMMWEMAIVYLKQEAAEKLGIELR